MDKPMEPSDLLLYFNLQNLIYCTEYFVQVCQLAQNVMIDFYLQPSTLDLLAPHSKDFQKGYSSGLGSMVSSLSSLSRLIVFSASASGHRDHDPMLFLRFWARSSALHMGWSRGRVCSLVMVFCARCWRRRPRDITTQPSLPVAKP